MKKYCKNCGNLVEECTCNNDMDLKIAISEDNKDIVDDISINGKESYKEDDLDKIIAAEYSFKEEMRDLADEAIEIDNVNIGNTILRLLVSFLVPYVIIMLMEESLAENHYIVLVAFMYLWVSWMSILKHASHDRPSGTRYYYTHSILFDICLRLFGPLIGLLLVGFGLPMLIGNWLNSETVTNVLTSIFIGLFIIYPVIRDIKIIVRTFKRRKY